MNQFSKSELSDDYKTIADRMRELNEAMPTAGIDTTTEIVNNSGVLAAVVNAKVIYNGNVIGSGTTIKIQESEVDSQFVGWCETIAIGRAIAVALKDDRSGSRISSLEEAVDYQEKLKHKLWNHFNNAEDSNAGIRAAMENVLRSEKGGDFEKYCLTQIQRMKNPDAVPSKEKIKRSYGW